MAEDKEPLDFVALPKIEVRPETRNKGIDGEDGPDTILYTVERQH